MFPVRSGIIRDITVHILYCNVMQCIVYNVLCTIQYEKLMIYSADYDGAVIQNVLNVMQ